MHTNSSTSQILRSTDEFQSTVSGKRQGKSIPMLVRSACAAATRIIRAEIFVDRLLSLLAQLLRHELEHLVCNFYCSKLFSRWWKRISQLIGCLLLSLSFHSHVNVISWISITTSTDSCVSWLLFWPLYTLPSKQEIMMYWIIGIFWISWKSLDATCRRWHGLQFFQQLMRTQL